MGGGGEAVFLAAWRRCWCLALGGQVRHGNLRHELHAKLQKTKIPGTRKPMKERDGETEYFRSTSLTSVRSSTTSKRRTRAHKRSAKMRVRRSLPQRARPQTRLRARPRTSPRERGHELALESSSTNSPRHRQPAVRTQGSVLERLLTDDPTWGLSGIEGMSTSEHTPTTSLAPNATSTTCRRLEEVDSEVDSEVDCEI